MVNQVVLSIPECVVNAISWAGSNGFVPYIKQESPSTTWRSESYTDEASRQYKLGLIARNDKDGNGEELDLVIDNEIKYKNGYTLRIEGEGKDFVKVDEQPGNVKLIFSPEADGKKIDLFVVAKNGSGVSR